MATVVVGVWTLLLVPLAWAATSTPATLNDSVAILDQAAVQLRALISPAGLNDTVSFNEQVSAVLRPLFRRTVSDTISITDQVSATLRALQRSAATDQITIRESITTSLIRVDTTPPTISAPANVSATTAPGTCGAAPALGSATASDNSSSVTVTNDAPAVFPRGSTIVTWTASDPSGNTASATQMVTVNDTQRPEIIAPANLTRSTGPTSVSATVFVSDADLGVAVASDNCPGVIVSRGAVPAGNLFSIGVTSIGYTATDASGNSSSATQTVTVVDTTPPTISGARTPAPNADGWNNTNVVVTFTCADAQTGIAGCTAPVSLSTDGAAQSVTGTATDGAGNTASTTVSGMNIDKTLPIISYAGNAGSYTVDQTVVITCHATDGLSGVASDTCANLNAPAYTLPIGTNTLSATASDHAGNTGTGSTTFTVGTTPTSLCTLTQQFVHSSAKYQTLPTGLKIQIDQKVTSVCASLALITPKLTPAQKAAAIAAYKLAVDGLAVLGYLTPAQRTTLNGLADTL